VTIKWSQLPFLEATVCLTKDHAEHSRQQLEIRYQTLGGGRVRAKIFPRTVKAGKVEIDVWAVVVRDAR
jgi:hypothetical protein